MFRKIAKEINDGHLTESDNISSENKLDIWDEFETSVQAKIKEQVLDLLGVNQDNIKNQKLVIFTCIRLDKYSKTDSKYEPIEANKQQYNNNKESIKSSLEFAHCANPVRQKEGKEYHKCLEDSVQKTFFTATTVKKAFNNQGGGTNPLYTQPFTTNLPQQTDNNNASVPQITVLPSTTTTSTDVPQVNPLVAYPVKPVNNDLVYFGQQMGFLYAVKIMRWGFHYKQSKTEFIDENDKESNMYNNILKDYIVTMMMIAVGVYATKNYTLFYALLFDEIMSILMFLKTKDEEILLVPYFLVFYGIDLLK